MASNSEASGLIQMRSLASWRASEQKGGKFNLRKKWRHYQMLTHDQESYFSTFPAGAPQVPPSPLWPTCSTSAGSVWNPWWSTCLKKKSTKFGLFLFSPSTCFIATQSRLWLISHTHTAINLAMIADARSYSVLQNPGFFPCSSFAFYVRLQKQW